MTIAKNLVSLREEFGLTQDDLASIAEVTPGAVSQWETGRSKPRMTAVDKIAVHLGIQKSRILDDDCRNYAKDLSEHRRIASGAKYTRVPIIKPDAVETHEKRREKKSRLGYVDVPTSIVKERPNAFLVGSAGDYMNEIIPRGSFVLVDPDEPLQDGNIIIARVDGADPIMRKYHEGASLILLSPESTVQGYEDIMISKNDLTRMTYVGTAVWATCTKFLLNNV